MRTTPASQTGFVEVRCAAIDASRTDVQVSDTLTALNAAGERMLDDFEGARFTAMIDDWGRQIAQRREQLLAASIR